MSNTPRTLVEFVDPSGEDNVLIKPREVHINGTPVMVEKDSIVVTTPDGEEVIKVMLTILPDQVIYRRGSKEHQHFENLGALKSYFKDN